MSNKITNDEAIQCFRTAINTTTSRIQKWLRKDKTLASRLNNDAQPNTNVRPARQTLLQVLHNTNQAAR